MNRSVKFIFIIFSIIFSAGLAKAGDFDWHKPIPCFGCHDAGIRAGYGGGDCGDCHEYIINDDFNVPLLETRHNPNICRACHFGNTMVNATMKEIFHNGHNNIECTRCHTQDNFTVIKIKNDGFVCVSCHSNKVHSIHINKLDKICNICHSSWANGKVYNTNIQSSNTSQENQLEKFTIFYFIKSLFSMLFGGK